MKDAAGTDRAALKAIFDHFMDLIGNPKTIADREEELIYAMWHSGQAQDPAAAYAGLYDQLSDDWKSNHPWARYGLARQDYVQAQSKLQSAWYDTTGNAIPDDVLHQALEENWSEAQLKQYIQSSSLSSGWGSWAGPWVNEGSTYTQAREQYIGEFGTAPASTPTLASWWNFRRDAKKIGAGGATLTEGRQQTQQQPGTSEVR